MVPIKMHLFHFCVKCGQLIIKQIARFIRQYTSCASRLTYKNYTNLDVYKKFKECNFITLMQLRCGKHIRRKDAVNCFYVLIQPCIKS